MRSTPAPGPTSALREPLQDGTGVQSSMAQNSTRHQEKQSKQAAGAQEAPPWGGGAGTGSTTSECPPAATSTPATRHGTTRPVLSRMTTKASFWAPPVQLSLQACPQIPAQPWGRGAGQSYRREGRARGTPPPPPPPTQNASHAASSSLSRRARLHRTFKEIVCVLKDITNKPQAPRGRGGQPSDAKDSAGMWSDFQVGASGDWAGGWAWTWEAGGSRLHLYPKPPSYF